MREMLKKTVIVFGLLVLCAVNLMAQKINLYANTPEEVQAVIAEVDKLIEEKQYQSAFYYAYPDVEGYKDYFIYKKVEVCTQWFLMSMMHQMFAFKNLEKGEDLMALRHEISYGSSEMTFNQTFYDPASVIENYAKENGGMTPVLYLALGDYYYDVINRYGEQWLKPIDELQELVKENYAKSIEKGVYSLRSMENYITVLMWDKKDKEALPCLDILIAHNGENGNYWFNKGATCMNLKDYETAKVCAENAIKYPEEDIDYQIEAYTLLADANIKLDDFAAAEKTMLEAEKKYKKQPYVKYQLAMFYLQKGDYEMGSKKFQELYKMDDSTLFTIVNVYLKAGEADRAADFTKALLGSYKKDKYKCANFHYVLAFCYYSMKDMEKAYEEAAESNKLFKACNKSNDPVAKENMNLYNYLNSVVNK